MPITYNVVDMLHIENKFEKIKDYDASAPLARFGAKTVRGAMKDCPVDTGRLRASISFESDEKECTVGTDVEYAPFVEFGTRKDGTKMAFLFPNVNKNLPDLVKEIKEDIC